MNAARIPPGHSRRHGFTLVEVSVVIVTVMLMVLLVMPRFAKSKPAATYRVVCVYNLKNIGLAARMFATDNDGKYPWQLSVTNGGAKELAAAPWNVTPQVRLLSNGFSSLKPLVCPKDLKRQPAANFAALTDANLSYFIGLDSNEEEPRSILSGDRNLTLAGVELTPGLAVLKPGSQLGFTRQIHQDAGNLLLGDGSARLVTPQQLNEALTDTFRAMEQKPIRLLIP